MRKFAYETHLTSRSFGHFLLTNAKRLHQLASQTYTTRNLLPLVRKAVLLLKTEAPLSHVCHKRLTTEN